MQLPSLILGCITLALSSGLANAEDPFGTDTFAGAVYTMNNDPVRNQVVAFARSADGQLTSLGSFPTGGAGTGLAANGDLFFDTGDGLDPLQSTNAIELSTDRRFLFVVNAGSNSVSTFLIGQDLVPVLASVTAVDGVGPNSIAYRDGVVVVASIDADGVFMGGMSAEGAIESFRLAPDGTLTSIPGSRRELLNRTGGVKFSPDGRYLIVTSLNAAGPLLLSGNLDEVTVFAMGRDGVPSEQSVSTALSVDPAVNPQRASPLAIGVEVVEDEGRHFVVVTEARSIFTPRGVFIPLALFQAGSVSTWELMPDGSLDPIDLDVFVGPPSNTFLGQRASCWLQFSKAKDKFYVVSTADSTIGSFSFDKGEIEIIDPVAAAGNGPGVPGGFPATIGRDVIARILFNLGVKITQTLAGTDAFLDMGISDDGKYIYQTLGLAQGIYVYRVEPQGGLTLIQTVLDPALPVNNIQGIAAF